MIINPNTPLANKSVTTDKIADSAVTWPKLAADARPTRRNLLNNWYFVGGGSQQGGGQFPINQRGQTEYVGSGHTIDKWRTWSSNIKVTLTADGIILQNQATSSLNFTSYFEPAFWKPLEGKTATASLLTSTGKMSVLTFTVGGYGDGNSIDDTCHISAWIASDATPGKLAVAIGVEPGKTTDPIVAVKLELGDTQTLAHQDADGNWVLNDPPPNFAEELAKCRRYFYRLRGDSTSSETRIRLSGCTTNTLFFNVPMPAMRAKPTVICVQSDTVANDWIRSVNNNESIPLSQMNVEISYVPEMLCGTLNFVKINHGLTDAMLAIFGYIDFSADL